MNLLIVVATKIEITSNKLKQYPILITGVGKGLGRNMVESFSKSGAFVYGVTRSKSDLKFFKNLKNVKIFCGDVRNSSIFKKILRQSEIDKRPISGLVNNAGIRQRKKFSQITKRIQFVPSEKNI